MTCNRGTNIIERFEKTDWDQKFSFSLDGENVDIQGWKFKFKISKNADDSDADSIKIVEWTVPSGTPVYETEVSITKDDVIPPGNQHYFLIAKDESDDQDVMVQGVLPILPNNQTPIT